MSGPIERAYAGLGGAIAEALAGAGFLTDGAKLEIDPTSANEFDGESGDLQSAAILLKGDARAVRTFLGAPPRYAVERSATLELAIAGPDPDVRELALNGALIACAAIPQTYPPVGGAERIELRGQEYDDLPPNGVKTFLTFVLRVRSGDVLGLTD